MKLNINEAACDLADMMMTKLHPNEDMFYEEDEVQYYKEAFQGEFDHYYDQFWEFLEQQGFKNECV